ncbi:hypothetical protein [Candidatus Nitrotoga sp. M5]|uniref:hypothetical protein n=1 Tax=Candidatus Nitrotoga sp. M5 TaxID=2890409 RepID=UPI001EF28AC5|nr:hypothetical protein [Candidatus Nitrotoga sp. M5]CAH1386607.1 exported hypothetical protein [Candidatus Nitrotoga sp. M5]
MKKLRFISALCAVAFSIISISAHASLTIRAGGFVYDDVLDITWMQPGGFVAPNVTGPFRTANDAFGTIEWAENLSIADPLRNKTWDDWRLPSISRSASDGVGNLGGQRAFTFIDCSTATEAACRDNEMGYMFHQNGISVSSPGPFTGLQSGRIWSSTEGTPTIKVWSFDYGTGLVSNSDQNRPGMGWAVRDGDVGEAPPGAQSCARILNPTNLEIASPGGSGFTVSVTIPSGCNVTGNGFFATSNDSRIQLTGGSGPFPPDGAVQYFGSTVTYSVDPNLGPNLVTGTITIAGQIFTVTQLGVPVLGPPSCARKLNPTSANIPAAGGSGFSVSVTEPSGCFFPAVGFLAKSNDSWIHLTGGSGSPQPDGSVQYFGSNASVIYTVDPNPGQKLDIGTITIDGQTFKVNQAGTAPLPNSASALEIPGPGSFNSGVGQISGWSCAGPVTVSIDGKPPVETSYGSARGDTAGVCGGKVDNGFILLTNYNLLGAGAHTAQILVNGVPAGNAVQFNVTVPAGEFLVGASGGCTAVNFPNTGLATALKWQQGTQNFAITSNVNLPQITPLPDSTSALEIPGPDSFNSGVGQISGWSCAGPVTVSIDGKPPVATSYGSSRGDTAGVCSGKVDNGFILLTNYNLLGPGAHTAQILVNGAPRGAPTSFAVSVPGGVEFLTGASGGCTVSNFPSVGRSTVLNWQQSIQNFSIQSVSP